MICPERTANVRSGDQASGSRLGDRDFLSLALFFRRDPRDGNFQHTIFHGGTCLSPVGIFGQLERSAEGAVLPFAEVPCVALLLVFGFLFPTYDQRAVIDRQLDVVLGYTRQLHADAVSSIIAGSGAGRLQPVRDPVAKAAERLVQRIEQGRPAAVLSAFFNHYLIPFQMIACVRTHPPWFGSNAPGVLFRMALVSPKPRHLQRRNKDNAKP